MDVASLELAVRAYEQGFAVGADLRKRASGRCVVEPATHEHWRRGFEAGRAAAVAARDAYRAEARR